MSNLNIKHFST